MEAGRARRDPIQRARTGVRERARVACGGIPRRIELTIPPPRVFAFVRCSDVPDEEPLVPRTTPDRVFNIEYYPHDTKRPVRKVWKRYILNPLEFELDNEIILPKEDSAFRPWRTSVKRIDHVENDGYQ